MSKRFFSLAFLPVVMLLAELLVPHPAPHPGPPDWSQLNDLIAVHDLSWLQNPNTIEASPAIAIESGYIAPHSAAVSSPEQDLWPKVSAPSLSERVLTRLEKLERLELDPWQRDDLRIAWITVLYASRGNQQPHVDATYRVLGLHPDKIWPRIVAHRKAALGELYEEFWGEQSSPKKPVQSAKLEDVLKKRRAA